MNDRLIIILFILAAVVGSLVTWAVYDDPRCIVAECRIVK